MNKQLIFIFLITISLFACNNKPDYINGNSTIYNSKGILDQDIRYFKDERTGLCFAERGLSDTYTFTCVPCGVLERINKQKNDSNFKVENSPNSSTRVSAINLNPDYTTTNPIPVIILKQKNSQDTFYLDFDLVIDSIHFSYKDGFVILEKK